MSYASADTSIQSGRPVELFRFAHGANTYLYNSGPVDQSYDGDVYAAAPIERGQVEASQEFGRAYLDITVPYDNAVATLFTSGYPDGHVTLAIYRSHVGETEWISYWRGRVVSVAYEGHKCKMRCEPVFTALQRAGLRAVYQLQCRHVLYGTNCGAVKASHSVASTVTLFIENQVFVNGADAYADGWFAGGEIETPHGRRMIVSHTGNSLMLSAGIPGLTVNDAVTLAPGCDHTVDTCTSKFSNDLNFGGFPYLPKKNPFSGDAIV